jgi:hypothetical protein
MKRKSLRFAWTILPIIGTLLVTTAWAGSFTFQKGDIVVGFDGQPEYRVYDANGKLLTTLDTHTYPGLGTGGAFEANGNLIVTNFVVDSASWFNKNGKLLGGFGCCFNLHPESVTFDKSGNVYIGQADGLRQVLEFNSTGTKLLNSWSPMPEQRGTDWIDMAPDGHTLFYTSEGHNIMRFDTATGTQLSNFATGLPGQSAYALKVLPNGEVLVADWDRALLLDTSGNIIRTYTDPSLNFDTGLAILPDGKSFIADNSNLPGEIFQFNIATGALEQTIFPGTGQYLSALIVFEGAQTPEPSTLVMFGSGLIGLAGLLRPGSTSNHTRRCRTFSF